MGYLTTHVLDVSAGLPGAGIRIQLFQLEGDGRRLLAEIDTNTDGRSNAPLLAEGGFVTGRYELVFAVGAYFRNRGLHSDGPAFLEDVVVRFGVSNPDAHYHVPLLVSPYGYSTYRGS